MNSNDARVQQQMQALRSSYAAQLPDKIKAIDAHWQLIRHGTWDTAVAATLQRLTHSMAGSGGTFGFPELGEVARDIEQLLKFWMQEKIEPDNEQCARLDALLDKLQQVSLISAPEIAFNSGIVTVEQVQAANEEQPLIYLIEDDTSLAGELALQLELFGYRLKTFTSTTGVEEAVIAQRPNAFIVDINLPEGDLAGVELLGDIQLRHGPGLPVIFISSHLDFKARLAAVRAGGEAYFVKPLEIAPLIDRLDNLTRKEMPEPYRILTIDDDETLAAHYALLLSQAGMEVRIVAKAEEIMETLADFKPDLILMDIYMPECSGLELAKLIRQHEAYLSIPIVYLSSETDHKKQFSAMHMGGDDFLTKPVKDQFLISSVKVRAERARILNSLMIKDSLTGLLKHTMIKEQLAQELSRAKRSHSALGVVMIDIDNFKAVNDTYGHMVGDRIIKSLARMLKQRLRNSDKIGRYGGEEFAVVMPDCDPELALKVIDGIRKDFSELRYQHEGVDFSVTFSAGISGYPGYEHDNKLLNAADEALYEAKQRGRNQVVVDKNPG